MNKNFYVAVSLLTSAVYAIGINDPLSYFDEIYVHERILNDERILSPCFEPKPEKIKGRPTLLQVDTLHRVPLEREKKIEEKRPLFQEKKGATPLMIQRPSLVPQEPKLIVEKELLQDVAEIEQELFRGHTINFSDVPMEEFVRYVSKISEVNFIFNRKELDFHVSLSSGKPVSAQNVLSALLRILRMHGFWVKKEDAYFVIHKIDPKHPPEDKGWDAFLSDEEDKREPAPVPPPREEIAPVIVVEPSPEPIPEKVPQGQPFEFFVYKLKYHQGSEIKEALKQVALELQIQPGTPQKLLSAIQTVQWVEATNSLLCSGDEETILSLKRLIESVDTALKQVFIEVLVIETDVNRGQEFGLQWGAGGQVNNRVGLGVNSSPAGKQLAPFAQTLQGIDAQNTPSGLGQFPVGSGFDLGVIGDLIFHKGRSFLSLGALVSALQEEGGTTIVLNQKIIAQDNKPSQIFVGENIPFTGSVTQLVGPNQQTTSNIDYRDIGVSLNIKPMLGDDGVVTLDLQEEISETMSHPGSNPNLGQASGIRTTKTNMVTHVHVPDQHFLVLSGMMRNAKRHEKSGIPCLGGLPLIGSLFSKKVDQEEKRNIIIFVRPHIIRSVEDYQRISSAQRELHRAHSPSAKNYDEGLQHTPRMLPAEESL